MIKKLRDITPEEWKKAQNNTCYGMLECSDCIFKYANCSDEDDAWVNHKEMYSDKFLDQEIEIEMPHKTIPRGCIDKKWKWVARDSYGGLSVFTEKPIKGISDCWYSDYFCDVTDLMDNTLADVKWSDSEPTQIED